MFFSVCKNYLVTISIPPRNYKKCFRLDYDKRYEQKHIEEALIFLSSLKDAHFLVDLLTLCGNLKSFLHSSFTNNAQDLGGLHVF